MYDIALQDKLLKITCQKVRVNFTNKQKSVQISKVNQPYNLIKTILRQLYTRKKRNCY